MLLWRWSRHNCLFRDNYSTIYTHRTGRVDLHPLLGGRGGLWGSRVGVHLGPITDWWVYYNKTSFWTCLKGTSIQLKYHITVLLGECLRLQNFRLFLLLYKLMLFFQVGSLIYLEWPNCRLKTLSGSMESEAKKLKSWNTCRMSCEQQTALYNSFCLYWTILDCIQQQAQLGVPYHTPKYKLS